MRKSVLVCGPISSRSGYGNHARDIFKALHSLDKYDITDFGGWHEDEKSGQQGLSQEMFIYPLIKAIQELTTRVKELEAK